MGYFSGLLQWATAMATAMATPWAGRQAKPAKTKSERIQQQTKQLSSEPEIKHSVHDASVFSRQN
jgi:hypothetical protein